MRGRKPHPLSLAKKKWARHKAQAKYIGIEFNFSFEAWYQWWLDNGVDKNVDVVWDNKDRACMCRIDEKKGYEPSNVIFGTNSENVKNLHASGKYNPNRKATSRKYRWGNDIITFDELVALRGPTKEGERNFFDARYYDWENQHETDRLVNRWNTKVKRYKRLWETPAGKFDSLGEAAASVGVTNAKLLDMYQRPKYNKLFKKHKFLISVTLDDYVKQHSRYPDPYYFKR